MSARASWSLYLQQATLSAQAEKLIADREALDACKRELGARLQAALGEEWGTAEVSYQ